MDFQKKNIKNICSFYASEWHLAVMLLPYLNKQIEKGVRIETIFREEIVKNIKELISKLNLNKNMENKMLNINWNINEISGYKEIEKLLKDLTVNEKEICIILNGSYEQVEENNKIINKCISKDIKELQEKGVKINIISCFKAFEYKKDINALINKYDYALNTSGEHKIEEIFSIYKKVISY